MEGLARTIIEFLYSLRANIIFINIELRTVLVEEFEGAMRLHHMELAENSYGKVAFADRRNHSQSLVENGACKEDLVVGGCLLISNI